MRRCRGKKMGMRRLVVGRMKRGGKRTHNDGFADIEPLKLGHEFIPPLISRVNQEGVDEHNTDQNDAR
jgi:hypothetical protein